MDQGERRSVEFDRLRDNNVRAYFRQVITGNRKYSITTLFYITIVERESFIHKVKEMKSVDDFIKLLNGLRYSRYGEKCKPITRNLLYYYASNKVPISNLYTDIYIPKKSGGKRKIQIPCRGLKEIQGYIAEILNALFTPQSCVTGFVRGKNIIDNAKPHVGHKYLLSWDIKDFFSSIYAKLVKYCLVNDPFNFPDDIANLITNICGVRIEEDSCKRVLPQGSPCSPILSNIVFAVFDKYIVDHCTWRGVIYTRYADDMTFSADHDFYYDSRFSWGRVLPSNGQFYHNKHLRQFFYLAKRLNINKKKTRKCKQGQRKIVTGIVVNDKLNVKREYVREIRNLLFIWEKYGYNGAKARFNNHVHKSTPNAKPSELLNVLVGRINFIKQVKGKNDPIFLRFKTKLKYLCSIMNTSKAVSIRLKTGLFIKGNLISLDLDKGIELSVAGKTLYVQISAISEIIQD